MINKIVTNKIIIAKVLLILAIALFVPEIINLFSQDFEDVVFTLILHSTAILSAIYLLVMLFTNKELSVKALVSPACLLFVGPATSNVRNLIDYNTWSSVYYIALYGAAIVAFILLAFCDNKKIKYVVYMLFLVILTLNLLGVFNGSAISLARLIIGLIIIGNVYLNLNNKVEDENNENN